ncbi:aromatic prenyltransferase [Colletotrichum falcatum]|nr:aromatic prenyltransferase [Colletotrichum falcatum]
MCGSDHSAERRHDAVTRKPSETDEQFWSSRLVPRIRTYMEGIGSYTPEDLESHVSAFAALVKVLGPKYPHPCGTLPTLTWNCMPIEISINLSEGRNPAVRYYLEALGAETATEHDPFGEASIPSNLALLSSNMTSVDMTWPQRLRETFCLDNELERKAVTNLLQPPRDPPMVAFPHYYGVDNAGPQRSMKFTVSPPLKFLAGGGELRNIVPDYNYLQPEAPPSQRPGGATATMCATCVESGRPKPVLGLVSVDCADPATARIKLYTRIKCTAFACMRDIVTLGGRLTDDETLEGLRRLRSIWPLLLNDPASGGDESYQRPLRDPSTWRHGEGIMVSFELSARFSRPEVKLYAPLYQCHAHDVEIIKSLNRVFATLGWNKWEGYRYERLLRDVNPGINLQTTCTHTFASFCYYKKQGSYLTIYYTLPKELINSN